jgi:hypothetical protein
VQNALSQLRLKEEEEEFPLSLKVRGAFSLLDNRLVMALDVQKTDGESYKSELVGSGGCRDGWQ